MKKLIILTALCCCFALSVNARKKEITNRTWVVYSPLSENGDTRKDGVKQTPIALVTFKSNGTFTEDLVKDKVHLTGKWSWNKKPETAGGKKCLNLVFDNLSNVSPQRKVYVAIDIDYEIVKFDYNFEGHDKAYTGFSHWNTRVTINEVLGDWMLSFDEAPEDWPDKNVKITMVDKNGYSLESVNGEYKESGTWLYKYNYIIFKATSEKSILNDIRLEPAYNNGKTRIVKFKIADDNYVDATLKEVIAVDQLVGKWLMGELQIEFTKSLKFKTSSTGAFDKYLEKSEGFNIYRWELKDNVITFYPGAEDDCKDCSFSIDVNLYADGRELTLGSALYESGQFKKIQ